MEQTKPLTPEEKLDSIAQQIRCCQMGLTNSITCPYCGFVNEEGLTFCCPKLMSAAAAILQRQETEANIELADRIAENTSRN